MAGMEGLGRLFNVVPTGDDVYVPMDECTGVTFIGVNAAGETWTVTEQKADGSGDQVLPCVTHYYVQATSGAAWARVPSNGTEQAAASAVVTTASQDVVAIFVSASQLSDGYNQVKLASTGAGTVTAIMHDLRVKRAPENLRAVV